MDPSVLLYGVLCALSVVTLGTASTSTLFPPITNDVCTLPANERVDIPGGCNFNKDTCGYTFPDILWERHTESVGSVIFGPVADDNNGDGLSQTFAVFQSNNAKINNSETRAIVSPPINGPTNLCLRFWMLMPNQNSAVTVNVTSVAGNSSGTVFQFERKLTSQWRLIEVPLHQIGTFTVSFISTKENNYGYVGIDSVRIQRQKLHTTTPGPTTTTTTTTPVPTTPTTQTTTEETTIATTTTPVPTTPTTKTTTTTEETTTDRPTTVATSTITNATTRAIATTIVTSQLTTTENVTMVNETTATTPFLPITTPSKTTSPTPSPTTTTAAEPTTESTIETTTVSADTTTTCSCVCPASKCSTTPSPTTAGKPPSPSICSTPVWERTALPAYSCTFDVDLCDYTLSSYPHLWEVNRYHYGNKTVGLIDGDHSTDHSGGYMVFNTFNYHVQSTNYHKFSSPYLQGNVTYCVTFWYNMPTSQSSLTVYTVTANQKAEHLIWRVENTPTTGWMEVSIEVGNNDSFMLQFSSTKNSTEGFVAVDDIHVSVAKNTSSRRSRRDVFQADDIQMPLVADDASGCNCTCPPDPCDVTTTVAPYGPGTCGNLMEAVHVRDLSCNFDKGTSCGYQLPIYPHLWELRRFRYGNVTLGEVIGDKSPDGDGVYVAFSTNNYHVVSGMRSQFVSQSLTYRGDVCVRFWYNMPTARSTLQLHVIEPGTDTLVWREANMMTATWRERYVRVTVNGTFQIAFSSTKTGLDSYLAVDDIHVYKNLH